MHTIAVVHLALEPLDSPADPLRVDKWIALETLVTRQQSAGRQTRGGTGGRFRVFPNEPVSEREVQPQERPVPSDSPVGRKHERYRPDQMRHGACQGPAFPREPAQRAHVAGLQRPYTTMYRLRTVGGGAAAEVPAVDDRNRQAAQRRIPGGNGTVDATANHQEIETAACQPRRFPSHRPYNSGSTVRSTGLRMTSTARIREYWNRRIHDLDMTDYPVGSLEFFDALDEYRFDKLRYLPTLVEFQAYENKRILEVGCGIGTDLVRFARSGARVTGVDLAIRSIELARRNAELHRTRLEGLCVGDGEALPFGDRHFDVVYAHGVIQYAANPPRLVAEAHRVLKPGGAAIFMVYNRYSWLKAMSMLARVALEHAGRTRSAYHVDERVPSSSRRVRLRSDHSGTLSSSLPPASRLEGSAVQSHLRRSVQRPPAGGRQAARMALDGVVPEVNTQAAALETGKAP